MVYRTGDNNFGTAKWIVDATAGQGTHTTIATALTSSSSGDTIFIRPGTYTENLTLKAGVNLTAFGSDGSLNGTGKVIISGTCTLSAAGSVTISGIQLQTNSANLLVVSGNAASIVNLNNCYLNCTNTTGISYSSSSGSSAINCYYCSGDIGTTGIALYSSSGTGNILFEWCRFTNTGASTTASSNSAGTVNFFSCGFTHPLSTSSSGTLGVLHCNIDTASQNATCVTTAGTGLLNSRFNTYSSGSASSLSIGTGTTASCYNDVIGSSNTNAITGAGSITYSSVIFGSTSNKINTTTQTGGLLQGGLTQAPSAGWIGEQISAYASAVSLTNATSKNITSISLTAGVWDISIVGAAIYTGTSTVTYMGISATTNTIVGNQSDQYQLNNTNNAGAGIPIEIPSWRVVLTATTTYYLVAQANFSTGTCTGQGRISAVRTG